jgi:N-carbamoyl-L-amino-acid hydrolase
VVSAFVAIDELRAREVLPTVPVAVVAFSDEEGARFGVSCVGSRLLTGKLDPATARGLRDSGGLTLAEAMSGAGQDPRWIGRDDEALSRIGMYVELHIEQGRALVEMDAPVGVASAIWPHGRWRFTFHGEANHAGTTRLVDRRDPMLTFAYTVLAARKRASLTGAVATFGRVQVEPNGTNAIPSEVTGWLDARAADQSAVDELVEWLRAAAISRARRDGTSVIVTAESITPVVEFARAPQERLLSVLGEAPALPTGAGHDAGILASVVPSAMLFVRNPTGISHAPQEFAELDDCYTGAGALAAVMADWISAADAPR